MLTGFVELGGDLGRRTCVPPTIFAHGIFHRQVAAIDPQLIHCIVHERRRVIKSLSGRVKIIRDVPLHK